MEHNKDERPLIESDPEHTEKQPATEEPDPNESIYGALETIPQAQRTRERIAQLEDKQYQADFIEKWKIALEQQIIKLEEEVAGVQAEKDQSRDSSVVQASKSKYARLISQLDYLRKRLKNADTEAATELDRLAAAARHTVEELSWAIGQLYKSNPNKYGAMSPEELGKFIKTETAWAAIAARAEEEEHNIIRHARQAEIILANPGFPYVGLNELKRLITTIYSAPMHSEAYETAQTAEDWKAVLDMATTQGLQVARSKLRGDVPADIGDIKKDY